MFKQSLSRNTITLGVLPIVGTSYLAFFLLLLSWSPMALDIGCSKTKTSKAVLLQISCFFDRKTCIYGSITGLSMIATINIVLMLNTFG